MGMFDTVKYEADCVGCGRKLTDWQSKSGKCIMEVLEPWQVDNMYTLCPDCRTWNEYYVDAEVEVIVKSIKITLSEEKSVNIDNDP